jgi:hypothetical protein
MATTAVENLPANWDDARDIPFFRITARLFTPEFCLGASVLLGSYDDDTADTVQLTSVHHGSSTTLPAGIDDHNQPGRDLIPVRVRRTR